MRCQIINIIWVIDVNSVWSLNRKSESPSSPTLSSNIIEWNEEESLFELPLHQKRLQHSQKWLVGFWPIWDLSKDWWLMLSCQNCKSKHYDVEKWWKYHDTRIEHQHCNIFAFDLIVFFWFFFIGVFYWQIDDRSWRRLLTVQWRWSREL